MTANKPAVFGITGGSGSGKSYVSGILAGCGVAVFDADRIAHEVTAPGKAAHAELFAHFGAEYFASDGQLLRRKLAALVFSDSSELRILNEITHKHIKEELIRGISSCKAHAAAIDGAVIIGSPVERLCSFLVGVTAPEEIRVQRITLRDGITPDEARARIAAQPDEGFYRAHCKYIIENDGRRGIVNDLKLILSSELGNIGGDWSKI